MRETCWGLPIRPPSKQPGFLPRRGGRATRECANVQRGVCSLRPPVAPDPPQQFRRTESPSRHASKPPSPKKADFTRNRTHPMMKINLLPLPKKHTKATGNTVRDLPCEERKGGKIRLVGTISRDVMRKNLRRQAFTKNGGRLFLKPFCRYQKPSLFFYSPLGAEKRLQRPIQRDGLCKKRETGLEPATACLEGRNSTN